VRAASAYKSGFKAVSKTYDVEIIIKDTQSSPTRASAVTQELINAGADIGAIAAAINLLVPIPPLWFVLPVSAGILAVQVFGKYRLIERVFKWLALALLAYIASAFFSHPDMLKVIEGTLIPTIRLDPGFIAILVALLGTDQVQQSTQAAPGGPAPATSVASAVVQPAPGPFRTVVHRLR